MNEKTVVISELVDDCAKCWYSKIVWYMSSLFCTKLKKCICDNFDYNYVQIPHDCPFRKKESSY